MESAHRIFLLGFLCDLFLGLAVFSTDTKRSTGRSFLLLSCASGGWLVSLDRVFFAQSVEQAEFWIRLASIFGALVMPCIGLLRTSIVYNREHWSGHLWRVRWWFFLACLLAAAECTPYFIQGMKLGVNAAPVPIYGWAEKFEALFIFSSLLVILGTMIRDQFGKKVQGVQRVELQFVLLAFGTVVVSIVCRQVFASNSQSVIYTPLRAVSFHLIIAYGISSRGILHVRAVFRLMLSYLLLSLYASVIFVAAWFLFQTIFHYFGNDSAFAPALCVAVLTALLFNATGTPVRKLTQKLLPPEIDFEKIITEVSNLVQSVITLETLFDRFVRLLARSIGSPKVRVLLCESGGWREQTGDPDQLGHLLLGTHSPLVAALRAGAGDVAMEELQRRAPSLERDQLLAAMERIDAELCLPVRYHGELSGILTVAPRPSGHLYGASGRATLGLIARQLGIAIANARLYTEARQSQAYNQFLVENLPCGVIATDPIGALTVVNPAARRLLLADEEADPLDIILPEDIAQFIPEALAGKFAAHNEEIILREGARDQAQLRVACLPFAGERDRLLGVLLVLIDHTTLDQLQRQIRQADRLAGIGTLASGMAHEIKNPLVALKTFAQLLPKRYDDAEFRTAFSSIVGGEIIRIEGIVNQLLAFARPAPPMIEQINMHDTISNAIKLVGLQASRTGVELRTAFHAESDYVAADKAMLQQVVLNLLLNGIQAVGDRGWVEVTTGIEPATEEHEPTARIDVRDSGRGISPDNLAHIFDPFFTTKSEGTGLGLSVSYNIIAEHRGRLEAQSPPGEGACFSIYLPTC